MKRLILVLALGFGSCKLADSALGVNDPDPDRSEQVISQVEDSSSGLIDLFLPGLGGALAALLGVGLRNYVKKRKGQ